MLIQNKITRAQMLIQNEITRAKMLIQNKITRAKMLIQNEITRATMLIFCYSFFILRDETIKFFKKTLKLRILIKQREFPTKPNFVSVTRTKFPTFYFFFRNFFL